MPLLLLAYLGFISLGLPDGLLGVGWPHMRAEFGAPVGAVGFILVVATAGYLLAEDLGLRDLVEWLPPELVYGAPSARLPT